MSLVNLIDEIVKNGEKFVLLSEQQSEALTLEMERSFKMKRTPELEMRYMEGFLGLPLNSLNGNFDCALQIGLEKCSCGREPNALDVVVTAVNKLIHTKELVAKTLTSGEKIFESSPSGRVADCLQCGQNFTTRGYKWKKDYFYALREE